MFLITDTISDAFYKKFATLCVFENVFFFRKDPSIFPKKTPNFEPLLRNITIAVAFYAKFAKIW